MTTQKILLTLIVLVFVISACKKEAPLTGDVVKNIQPTRQDSANTYRNTPQTGETKAEDVSQQETLTEEYREEHTQYNEEEKIEKAIEKIDWESIEDKSIVLLVNDFSKEDFVYSQNSGDWKIFVPTKEEVRKLIGNYNYKLITLNEGGKTIYVIKEEEKRENPSGNELASLPEEIIESYSTLVEYYSPMFSSDGPSSTRQGDYNYGLGY